MNYQVSNIDVMPTNFLASSPSKLDLLSHGVPTSTSSRPSSSMKNLNDPTLKKKNKSVSFAPKIRCLVVPSHRDMTKAEKEATWRTPDEAEANDLEIIQTVRAARRGLLPSSFNETACLRGLEAIICPATGRCIKKRQLARVNAVLDAQDKEWQDGHINASTKMLRTLSTAYSRADANRALMQAASDEAFCRGMRRLEAKAA